MTGMQTHISTLAPTTKNSGDCHLPKSGSVPTKLRMRANPYSAVVRERLAVLGLAQIPAPAIEFIEAQMVRELAKVAAKKVNPRTVSKAIFKSLSKPKTASFSAQILNGIS